MLQKGTGERFKYKQAVLEKHPNAICKGVVIGNWMPRKYYAVLLNDKRISETFRRAEDAWSDAWLKHVK